MMRANSPAGRLRSSKLLVRDIRQHPGSVTSGRIMPMAAQEAGGGLARRYPLRDLLFALAMTAVALGVFDWATGDWTAGRTAAERQARAVVAAESLLAAREWAPAGKPARQGVTADGFAWRIFAAPSARPGSGQVGQGDRLGVEVRWEEDGRKHVFLLTGRPPEPAAAPPAVLRSASLARRSE